MNLSESSSLHLNELRENMFILLSIRSDISDCVHFELLDLRALDQMLCSCAWTPAVFSQPIWGWEGVGIEILSGRYLFWSVSMDRIGWDKGLAG